NKIIEQFGRFILDPQRNIDRAKLAKLVFSDKEALASLEAIVHPYIRQAVDYLIEKAGQDVIVVEAIKLLESPLRERVDSIWVTTASENNQLSRLSRKRGMSLEEARKRMANQSSQEEKIAAADVVIRNNRGFDDTWEQVNQAWEKLFPQMAEEDAGQLAAEKLRAGIKPVGKIDPALANLEVERAKPRQAEEIARFINKIADKKLNRMDIMAAFGEKAFMILYANDQLVGVMGWQVENLVARVDEVWLDDVIESPTAVQELMKKIEAASKELQAEALLVFVDPEQVAEANIWQPLKYQVLTIPQLEVNAWQEAAVESQPPDTMILFKQLRVDRVLRPI
ncbi:MAG: dephospho-CoA kinase, partial [Anaerolineales bacterium]